jgi:hypothetical protein
MNAPKSASWLSLIFVFPPPPAMKRKKRKEKKTAACGTNSQLRTYRAHNSWPPALITSASPSTHPYPPHHAHPAPAPRHPYFPGRPTAGRPDVSRRHRKVPGRRAGRAPAAVDPRHADAGARPSKKPDVSSDRIGAASRRPRVVVNLSEWGSVCALPRGPGARATRVAVDRGYKCPAPHSEQVSSSPPLFLPLAAAVATASTSRQQGGTR